jgi:thiol-disulfide isomerase/thioredoxin
MHVTRVLAALSLAWAVAAPVFGQSAFPMGSHRMALQCPGGDLPFQLSLEGDGKGSLLVFLGNGSERIQVPEVVDDRQLVLRFPHYDSELRLDVDRGAATMHGEWIKRRGAQPETRMKVVHRGFGARFDLPAPDGDVTWPNGRYAVAFAGSKDPAVGVFRVVSGANQNWNCEGTFLTTLGDYRFLAGNSDGRTMKLSCFDGAHAFLFAAERQPDGTMRGGFWSSDSWYETWTASPDERAALPDGWKLTRMRDGASLGDATFRDFAGQPVSLDGPKFTGKVRVIEVFGSWCPNCHDHGAYMAELHRRYADRGLQVVGVAFEHAGDFARSVRQVETFVARHGATFPILIGGLSDKKKATTSLSLLDRVRSFPTTIFVDRDGKVRGIYQGWSGPATGEAHQRLRQRFESLVEDLLAGR